MGLFGSRPTAEIHLDPIDKPFYSSGDTITGTVVLENKKQISIGFIDLRCVGELFYQRTEYSGSPNGHTQVIDEHLPFFVAQKDLVSSMVSRLVNNVSYSSHLLYRFDKYLFSLSIGKNRIKSRNLSVAIFVSSSRRLTTYAGGGSTE